MCFSIMLPTLYKQNFCSTVLSFSPSSPLLSPEIFLLGQHRCRKTFWRFRKIVSFGLYYVTTYQNISRYLSFLLENCQFIKWFQISFSIDRMQLALSVVSQFLSEISGRKAKYSRARESRLSRVVFPRRQASLPRVCVFRFSLPSP